MIGVWGLVIWEGLGRFTFWEGGDEVVDFGVAACLGDLFVGCGGWVDSEHYVVADGACVL